MRYIILLSVAVFIGGCLFALPTDPFIDGNTYYNPELGVEVSTISGWGMRIETADSTLLVITRNADSGFQPTIRLYASHGAGIPPNKMLASGIAAIRASLDSLDTTSIRQDSTAGVDTVRAAILTYVYRNEGQRFKRQKTFFVNNERSITLDFLDLESQYADHEAQYKTIKSSVRVYTPTTH